MVAALQLPATEISSLSRQQTPSITSRGPSVSAAVVANIMQSISIAATPRQVGNARLPSINVTTMKVSMPPAAPAFKEKVNATQPPDTKWKSMQPLVSIEVLKHGTRSGSSVYTEEISLLANQVQTGLQARVAPVLIDDCTGGVYYLRDNNRRLAAIFKPADEEAYAVNNPKNNPEPVKGLSGIREGISAGDCALREVVAYLLDHQHFAKVPTTMFASVFHPEFNYKGSRSFHRKVGAVQAYIPHKDTADDLGFVKFNADDVQAIAILDIRLANQDRHGGNLLAVATSTAKQVSLIPIDHGACLPRISALSETSFVWLFWPQTKQPFSSSALEYIAALDASRDLKLLESNLPAGYQLEREAVLTLLVCTALLKFCALERRMTAHDIGLLMCREGTASQQEMSPSVLELLVVSSKRDAAVMKAEALLMLGAKQRRVLSKASIQDKAWYNYMTVFMAAFRRELVSHFSAK